MSEKKYKLRDAAGGAIGKAATIWPYRLVTRIWAQLLEAYPDRLRIETGTPITAVSATSGDEKHPYLLESPRGAIKAADVAYCTNGHTGHLLPRLRGKLFPFRGTMTVQDCGARFPDQGASRSLSFYASGTYDDRTATFDLGLHYMAQNARTGDVFIGGETEGMDGILNSDDSTVSAGSLQTLEKILSEKFSPDVWEDGKGPTIKSKWSGIMGFTADGVPVVGRLPENATGRKEGGEWIAAGFNGYGMGNCWLAGEALAAMMRGQDVSGRLPECYKATSARIDALTSGRGASRMFSTS